MTFRDRLDLDTTSQNRALITNKAEAAGWSVEGQNPLILEKDGRKVTILFSGGGLPTSVQWSGGNEFSSMTSTGYVNLNDLFTKWLPWEAKK